MKKLLTLCALCISIAVVSQRRVERTNRDGEKEIGYINSEGEEIGEWKTYKNGRLVEIANYNRQGTALDGPYIVYNDDSGVLAYKGQYKLGDKSGLWTYYFKSGKIRRKENYKKDELHGAYESYFDNGQLFEKSTYKNRYRQGETKRYYKNGNLLYKAKYDNGDVVGNEKHYMPDGKELPSYMALDYNFDDLSYTLFDKRVKIKGNPIIRSIPRIPGKATTYYANGALKKEYDFKDDFVMIKTYHPNGIISSNSKSEVRFVKSYLGMTGYMVTTTKIGMSKEYDKNGKVIKEVDEYYKSGLTSLKNGYYESAHEKFLKSAQINKNASAMYLLGINYYNGRGVAVNYKKSAYWHKQAIANNNKVYVSLAKSLKKITQGKEKKLKTVTSVAEKNTLKAEIDKEYKEQLGYLLLKYDIEKNQKLTDKVREKRLKEILWYYSKLQLNNAKKKEIEAKYKKLKGDLEEKKRIAQNKKKIEQQKPIFDYNLERVRAGKDNADDQYNLGIFYSQGLVTKKDLKKAVYWSNKAGQNGNIQGYANAGFFTLDQDKVLVNRMNALGKSAEDDKKWDALSKERNQLHKKALGFFEKVYRIKESKTDKYVLGYMAGLYKALKIDSETSREVNKLLKQ